MVFHKYLLSLCSVLTLGSCGYMVESSNQDITFLTPEAQNAKCHAYVDKIKYQVYPPQTLNIKKSYKDMKIVCNAPGNRRVEMFVPAQFAKRALWGGPAGVAWDYASQSSHYYPSIIAIDFSNEVLRPNLLPQHNNSDIRQPETYDLEEFKASEPRLNSDKYKTALPILRRGGEALEETTPSDDRGAVEGEPSDMQSVIQDLTENIDGAGGADSMEDAVDFNSDQNDALSEPIQIYPE